MGVRAEPAPWLHPIFVEHAQRAKPQVAGVIIVGKGEGMVTVQSAVLGVAPGVRRSYGQHGNPSFLAGNAWLRVNREGG